MNFFRFVCIINHYNFKVLIKLSYTLTLELLGDDIHLLLALIIDKT